MTERTEDDVEAIRLLRERVRKTPDSLISHWATEHAYKRLEELTTPVATTVFPGAKQKQSMTDADFLLALANFGTLDLNDQSRVRRIAAEMKEAYDRKTQAVSEQVNTASHETVNGLHGLGVPLASPTFVGATVYTQAYVDRLNLKLEEQNREVLSRALEISKLKGTLTRTEQQRDSYKQGCEDRDWALRRIATERNSALQQELAELKQKAENYERKIELMQTRAAIAHGAIKALLP